MRVALVAVFLGLLIGGALSAGVARPAAGEQNAPPAFERLRQATP